VGKINPGSSSVLQRQMQFLLQTFLGEINSSSKAKSRKFSEMQSKILKYSTTCSHSSGNCYPAQTNPTQ